MSMSGLAMMDARTGEIVTDPVSVEPPERVE